MSDTQWPRFEVFQQARAEEPHHYAGSVHAPDAEMALLNARDVFVRRPECLSLWVVPAAAIFSRTAQELEAAGGAGPAEAPPAGAGAAEAYHVFQKLEHKGTLVHRGAVEARTPPEALQRALAAFSDRAALVWWVFPARLVTRSERDDVDSLFEPARDKAYRQPSHYHTVALMHRIKAAQAGDEDE